MQKRKRNIESTGINVSSYESRVLCSVLCCEYETEVSLVIESEPLKDA